MARCLYRRGAAYNRLEPHAPQPRCRYCWVMAVNLKTAEALLGASADRPILLAASG
jgi:hypothetical protein